jgi:hypothetical protein
MVEKANISVRINPNNFIACEKKKINMMKMKLTINMYTQKGSKESVVGTATGDELEERGP